MSSSVREGFERKDLRKEDEKKRKTYKISIGHTFGKLSIERKSYVVCYVCWTALALARGSTPWCQAFVTALGVGSSPE